MVTTTGQKHGNLWGEIFKNYYLKPQNNLNANLSKRNPRQLPSQAIVLM
jgi:hypothetical protein